jgi:hypothetical protein
MVFHVLNRGVGRRRLFTKDEDSFYPIVRYGERNALRARGVERAEREDPAFAYLSTWPLPRPADGLQIVNGSFADFSWGGLRNSQIGGLEGLA